jgi:hypothetical protein
MPLIPIEADTGMNLPRARWSAGDRVAFARGVCREQRDNHELGRGIDFAALDDAAALAAGDAALEADVADVRLGVSTPRAARGPDVKRPVT